MSIHKTLMAWNSDIIECTELGLRHKMPSNQEFEQTKHQTLGITNLAIHSQVVPGLERRSPASQ